MAKSAKQTKYCIQALTVGVCWALVPWVVALTELCSNESATRSSSNTSSPKMFEEVLAAVALCTRAVL